MAIGDFTLSIRIGNRRRARLECLGVSRADGERFAGLFELTWATIPRWAKKAIVRGWLWRRRLGLKDYPKIRLMSAHRWKSQFYKGNTKPVRGLFNVAQGFDFCGDVLMCGTDAEIQAVCAHEIAHDFQFADDGAGVFSEDRRAIETNANQYVKLWKFSAGGLWPYDVQ